MGLTRKQQVMIVVLIIGTFVTVLNQTVVTPALPSVMEEMSVDASTAQWLTTGFTLVNAIMIPITAYLTDRFSTRRLFLTSMVVFTCGSLLATWGPNFPVLLAGRLVQAAGAGILMPMVMTVLMLTFPVEKRGTAMGLFGIVIAFGPAIGPTLAGIIIDRANWHLMFAIVSVLSALVIVVGTFALEKSDPSGEAPAALDKLSVVLSSVGFGMLLYGFSIIGSSGVNVFDATATLVGLVVLVLFFRRQLKMETPLLNVRVLQNRTFFIGTVIGMLVQAGFLVGTILMPIYVQTILGQSATVSGLLLLPGAILTGIMGPIAGRLFDRHGPRVLGLVGTGLFTLVTFAFAFLTTDMSIEFLTVLYMVRMVSLSLVNMPITTWGMNALDNKVINHGTSVNNTLRQVAGSLGTALIVSVETAVTNANATKMDATQANMLGINAAFAVAGVLCLVAFVMVVFLVKDRPADTRAADPDNERKSVLEAIMKRDVYSLPETATMSNAMQLFVEKGISAAPVVNAQGEPVGFVSDGDVMRALSRHDKTYVDPVVLIMHTEQDDRNFDDRLEKLMGMSVCQVGASRSIGVDIHADLAEVCRVLGENRLKKVPVMDEGRIVGMINRSDITQYSMKKYLESRE